MDDSPADDNYRRYDYADADNADNWDDEEQTVFWSRPWWKDGR